MLGVILAAGMAKRLRPLTDERPKCLLKVGERTLLQRTVDGMIAAGIRELVVVTGYRANMIRDFLLMDSDILCDPAIIPTVINVGDSALALNRHELGEEEMKVVADAEGRITEISKTCSPAEAAGESVGIEKIGADYSTALFRELRQMIEREGLIDIFYERAFERLIPQGHTFRIVDTTSLFSIELDTPEDFENAQRLIPAALW